jgi:signal transduction histidine kinase/ActR/RegA family two-component response regulator
MGRRPLEHSRPGPARALGTAIGRALWLHGQDVQASGQEGQRFAMSVSIRSRLLLLVLAVLLPGLVGLAYFIGTAYEAERDANTRTLRDTARALSMVVELELRQRAAAAQVLAGSRWLDTAPNLSAEQLEHFERLAQRALHDMEGWLELRASNGVLLDTRHTGQRRVVQGAQSAPPDGDEAFELSDLRLIDPLSVGATPEQAHAAVVEPVNREGRTVLNIAITIRPSELQRIIDAQNLPDGWVATVLDSRGRVVARYPAGEAYIGREATADLREHLAAGREGLFESVSLDGQHTTGYFSTTAQGWTYLSAMPRKQFAGLLPRSVLQLSLGALVLLGLAVGGAMWVSRRIVAPVNALKIAAAQVHAGQAVAYRPTGIVECDEVAAALARATETIQRARIDLELQVAQAVERTRLAEQRASHSQRVEALGRLTGGVAHDFNNLLGVVSNSAHLIERHPAATQLQLPLNSIRRAIAAGSQLTQHLLSFAGRRPLRSRTVELGSYLHEVRDLMRSVLGQRITVSSRVAADTRAVHVDASELELALINLALNARDAMPGGGELRLGARNALPEETEGLAGHPQRAYVLITVGDAGCGIEPDVAARVFEPFFTTKPVGKGTGLGLSQVLGFCVQAGGTARVASTPGLGTTVSLLLPAATAGSAPDQEQAQRDTAAAVTLAGTRVLLVEDNDELAQITAALLQVHGVQVQRAVHAAQALQQLTPPHDVDLVLSDVVMPGEIDGLTMARRLRSEQPMLPIVLVSGYSGTAEQATDFVILHKPCTEDDLLQAMAKALGPKPVPAPGDRA